MKFVDGLFTIAVLSVYSVPQCENARIASAVLASAIHLLLQYKPEWFTFLVLAYRGCPRKKAVKRM